MTRKEGLRGTQRVEDIVRASGVSRSTVFRYFAGKTVRPGAVAAIERALAVLAPASRTPSAGSRDFLVSVAPSYTRFRGYAEVLEGVLQRAHDTGASVRIGGYQDGAGLPQGVILLGKSLDEEDQESGFWRERGVPCVMVNRIPEETDRSWVSVDCREAAREAVTHLIDQGCRRIAVWNDEGSRVSRDKQRGYRDALAAAGLAVDPDLTIEPRTKSLEEAFAALMARPEPPDGWFCPDDETAIRVLSLAASQGIPVPGALAVVGMNDIVTAPHMVPSLTSVRFPFREMGLGSVDALLRLADHPWERSVRILLAHRLVVRDSSRMRRP